MHQVSEASCSISSWEFVLRSRTLWWKIYSTRSRLESTTLQEHSIYMYEGASHTRRSRVKSLEFVCRNAFRDRSVVKKSKTSMAQSTKKKDIHSNQLLIVPKHDGFWDIDALESQTTVLYISQIPGEVPKVVEPYGESYCPPSKLI